MTSSVTKQQTNKRALKYKNCTAFQHKRKKLFNPSTQKTKLCIITAHKKRNKKRKNILYHFKRVNNIKNLSFPNKKN
jgi:hypothetical protein